MQMYQVIEIDKLYTTIKDAKMPIKTTYKFAMLMQKVHNQLDFYKQEFSKILNEYAKKENDSFVYIDNGQAIAIQEGKETECNEKIQELQNLEVDLEGISFSLEELEKLDLTLEQLSCLMPLIK